MRRNCTRGRDGPVILFLAKGRQKSLEVGADVTVGTFHDPILLRYVGINRRVLDVEDAVEGCDGIVNELGPIIGV